MNLDARPMKQAIRASHFHIPTPRELRHNFKGSDRFSAGVAATVAQKHTVDGIDHPVWKPVNFTCRAKTASMIN